MDAFTFTLLYQSAHISILYQVRDRILFFNDLATYIRDMLNQNILHLPCFYLITRNRISVDLPPHAVSMSRKPPIGAVRLKSCSAEMTRWKHTGSH